MNISIDKGIAIPELLRYRYPFRKMKIGDSFFVINRTANAITSAAYNYRPKKFTARKHTEGGKKGIRCWRVE
jgi:hypothetical protein